MKAEELMTKKELAKHYKVSLQTISGWMRQGMPVAKKLKGYSPRFRLSETDEWHEGQTK